MKPDFNLLSQYREIDFLFLLISFNPNITRSDINQKYGEELKSMNLVDAQINELLNKLEEDGHIIKNGNKLIIHPNSKNFLGYYSKEMEETLRQKEAEASARRIQVGSYRATWILGAITALLTAISILLSLDGRKKEKKIEALQAQIDKYKERIGPE